MQISMRKILPLAGLAFLMAATGAAAQHQTVRVVGTIEAMDGPALLVKTAKGEVKLGLAEKTRIFGVEKVSLRDVKKGDFVGVGAMPQADGSQRAVQVTIFAESQRGSGEGFRPWSRDPKGTMTNATIDTIVGGVDGEVLTVKYTGGEKKIIVPPETVILRYTNGGKSDLKPGAQIAVSRAVKKADGSLEASRVNVGRGGYAPQ
jgi:hypothetical protein